MAWCTTTVSMLLLLGIGGGSTVAAAVNGPTLGYFLKNMNTTAEGTLTATTTTTMMKTYDLSFLDGYDHYRLLPGDFSYSTYHFDGLATVMRLSFEENESGDMEIVYRVRPYESKAYLDRKNHECIFFGTGTGPSAAIPTGGVCFRNPGVNLLPIGDQLWLTIDTSSWGRVDRTTLETVDAKAQVASFVLNAHPACDPTAPKDSPLCYVQHPCPAKASPYSKDVCFSTLQTSDTDLLTTIVSNATLSSAKIIQHSHSPCVTPNYVVSKLDAFVVRDPLANLRKGGVLKYAHQGEDNQWMVMDRRTNVSRILKSPGHSFVNNHFWNCAENVDGDVVVETVTATEDYLDNYFEFNLEKDSLDWSHIFHEPLRCVVPSTSSAEQDIQCDTLLSPNASIGFFDYPTFNPDKKMQNDYRWFYAIAPKDATASRWFDSVVKIDRQSGQVAASWDKSNVFLTEADFIPRPGATEEDDGVLITITYDNDADESFLMILNAKDLSEIASFPFNYAIPFHAHGISCRKDGACWTNP